MGVCREALGRCWMALQPIPTPSDHVTSSCVPHLHPQGAEQGEALQPQRINTAGGGGSTHPNQLLFPQTGSEGRVKIKAQRFQTALPPTVSHSFRKVLEGSVSCHHHQNGWPDLLRPPSPPSSSLQGASTGVETNPESRSSGRTSAPSLCLRIQRGRICSITTNTEASTDEQRHKRRRSSLGRFLQTCSSTWFHIPAASWTRSRRRPPGLHT